jgi:hypothetical protein
MIRLVLGEFADMGLTSQKVLPQRPLAAGFSFDFSTLDAALENLLGNGKKDKRGELGYISPEEFDRLVDPDKMAYPEA